MKALATTRRGAALMLACLLAAAPAALAQEQNSPFGSFEHDTTQPIEITSDSLAVDQARQKAIFSGDVVAGQGTMRMTAERIIVSYAGEKGDDSGTGRVDRLRAEGNVFLSNGAETARGEWADYDVKTGVITMGGGVVLSQGENAVSGEKLVIDLNAGTGEISGGRVKSVFTPPKREN